jgi:hypothetical protein
VRRLHALVVALLRKRRARGLVCRSRRQALSASSLLRRGISRHVPGGPCVGHVSAPLVIRGLTAAKEKRQQANRAQQRKVSPPALDAHYSPLLDGMPQLALGVSWTHAPAPSVHLDLHCGDGATRVPSQADQQVERGDAVLTRRQKTIDRQESYRKDADCKAAVCANRSDRVRRATQKTPHPPSYFGHPLPPERERIARLGTPIPPPSPAGEGVVLRARFHAPSLPPLPGERLSRRRGAGEGV